MRLWRERPAEPSADRVVRFTLSAGGPDEEHVRFEPVGPAHVLVDDDVLEVELTTRGGRDAELELVQGDGWTAIHVGPDVRPRAWNRAGEQLTFLT